MEKVSLLFCFFILVAIGFANGAEDKIGFYELKKENISMKFTNYGASIVSLVIPDKNGKPIDVVLGYNTTQEYQTGQSYFGAVVGRVANRIGGAQFKLNGKVYKLPANDGKNTLHGGPKGYSNVVWRVTKYNNSGPAPFIVFTYRSSDGEAGFPGALRVVATYTLLADGQLSILMKAKSLDNKKSPVSLAQHTYWNLGGHSSGTILDTKVRIFGQFYTALDENSIPTGKILYARGTAYDFTEDDLKTVGKRISLLPNGYDINYVLDDYVPGKMRKVAILEDDRSKVRMELASDAPGMQFYSGNKIKDIKGKGGFVYQAHAGLCLETQWYPDFVNHPDFPQSLVQHGKVYKHHMLFNFTAM